MLHTVETLTGSFQKLQRKARNPLLLFLQSWPHRPTFSACCVRLVYISSVRLLDSHEIFFNLRLNKATVSCSWHRLYSLWFDTDVTCPQSARRQHRQSWGLQPAYRYKCASDRISWCSPWENISLCCNSLWCDRSEVSWNKRNIVMSNPLVKIDK